MYPNTQLFIDGAWAPAASGRTLPVVNPATGEQIGTVAHAESADLDRALEAADKGFEAWRKISAFERSKIMRKAADLLRERADAIAPLMTLEQGKPLAEAKIEIMAGADIIDWFAEEARRTYGRVIPARAEGVYQLVVKEPVGPVAAFTPWNFPINQAVRKLSAALAAGCSIIVKAPEETPASPRRAGARLRRCRRAGGRGQPGLTACPRRFREYLIPHPVIRKISFTGSTAGRQAAGGAGRPAHEARDDGTGRPCAGDRVRRRRYRQPPRRLLAGSKFRNAGQVCVVADALPGAGEASTSSSSRSSSPRTKAVKVGDGIEPGTHMGPLANPRRIAGDGEPSSATPCSKGAKVQHRRQAHRQQGLFLRADRADRRADATRAS